MRIVMLEPLGISEDKVMLLSKKFTDMGHEFESTKNRITDEAELIEKAKRADVLIIANSPLSGRVIRATKNLKLISVAFTGIDHIDTATCREKGIMVCNAQGYSTDAVAELTYGLIFALLRNILPCHQRTKEGKNKDGLVGTQLSGKTIGIVGTGAIGKRVAQIAKVFGCKILGYSRSIDNEALDIGIEYTNLATLMKDSDIVTLHVPLTEETKLLINEENISLMKADSMLINVARGGVVDSVALAKALNEDKIAGAGIDVFEMEPPVPVGHPLLTAKNVVLTPHVAFATEESLYTRAQITFDNISAWMDGKPQNVKL